MAPHDQTGAGRTGMVVSVALAILVAAAAITLVVKNRAAPAPQANVPAALNAPDQTYLARGTIVQLPNPADTQIHIAHEAIPEFKDQHANVVGMGAMVMPFTPAEHLDLSTCKIGDFVEFTFEVRWTSEPRALVVSLRPLPPNPG